AGARRRLRFRFEKLEENRHAIPHRLFRERNVKRSANKYWVVAIAREVGRFENASLHARTEQRPMPAGQRAAEHRARILTLDDAYKVFLDQVRGLKIY